MCQVILGEVSYTPITTGAGTTYYYCILTNSSSGYTTTSNVSGAVTVRSAFTTGAISTTGESICSGGTPTVIGSSTAASGGDGTITYSWRSSSDSYASAISGATSATYTPPAGLTSTTSYRRYANDGTCSTTPTVSTGTWTVTVNQPSTAAVLSGTATITLGNSTNLSVAITGGTSPYTVVYSNGTSNTTVNSYTSGSNISVSPTATTTYTLVSVTDANGCAGSGNSGSAVITVNAGPTASVLSGTATICSGTSTNLSVAITGGTSPFTVVYSNGTSNTTVSSYISEANISVSPTANTTYTLVSVTDANSNAGTGNSGSAVVTVTSPSVAGSISGGGVTVVSGSNSTTLTLSGYTGSIQWQSSTTSSSTGFADIVGATSATYTATNLSATTYYQAVVTNGVCSSATASSVSISMLTAPSITYTGASGSMQFVRNSAITPLTLTNTGGAVSGVYRQVSDFAGSGTASFNDGTGTSATFNDVTQIAINSSGDLFLADANNNRIRKITASGVVTTFAGSGVASSVDGQGTAATLKHPHGIAINPQGEIFVAEAGGNRIRKITAAGYVSTFAGTGTAGSSDNVIGTSATFNYPWGLCFDASGNLFVADLGNSKVRKITPSGVVSTYGASQTYSGIRGMAFDNSGNLYVNCYNDKKIYKITPSETVSVFVGSTSGDVDGNGTSVKTGSLGYMQLGTDNYIYFTDIDNSKIKKMSLSADVTTVVGGTLLDGNGNSTAISNPYGLVFDGLGNAYSTLYGGNKIKKISFLGYSISPSLPSGLSLSSANGTISGTPTTTTAATTYTISATNAAGSSSTTVTFATGPTNTITLSSAAGTNAQTKCANTAITNITYNTTTATGATFSGLPTGVTGAWASNVVTISGTPTVAGSYSYTVTLTGGIGTVTATGTITVSETPVIASQSTATQTVCQNATAASFSVTATGTGTSSYQWYSNTSASNSGGTSLGSANGAQTATYTPQTTATGTKYYYCVVTIGSCTATSAISGAVVVTPLSVAGSISGAGGTCYGTAKTLTLSGNTGTIQWQVSTTSSSSGFADISGETASTYVVPTTTATGTYYYQAVVTNGVCSAATTASVTVNVNALPVIVSQSSATQTICQYLTATTLSVSATGTSLTYQWYSNTSASNSGGTIIASATSSSYTPSTTVAGTLYYYCVVTNGSSCTATSAVSGAIIVNAVLVVAGIMRSAPLNGLNFDGSNDNISSNCNSYATTSELTYELWIKPNGFGSMNSVINHSGWAAGYVHFQFHGSQIYFDINGGNDNACTYSFSTGTWTHIAAVYSATAKTLKFYINGNLQNTITNNSFPNIAGSVPLTIGSWDNSRYFNGTMDEVRIWNTARTEAQIQNAMNNELSGAESGLVAYYNFNQGTAGGTNTGVTTLYDKSLKANHLTLNNFALSGSTSNWITGKDVSNVITNATLRVSNTIQLSNSTTGGTWSTTDANIATVDNTGLVTAIATGSATISYAVTNVSSCTTTATTVITVSESPVVTSQTTPAQTLCLNATASTYSVTASGSSLTYQWYSNTTATNSCGILIGGATSSTYVPPTSTLGTKYYYCVVSTSNGLTSNSDVSDAVIVNAYPVISSQSTATQTRCQNVTATALTVTATGTGLTYQWFSNATSSNSGGTSIASATSNSYSPSTATVGTTYYYCEVTNSTGCKVTSSVSGAIIVNTLPVVTSSPSTVGQTICQYLTATTLSVSATGTSLTYQWYSNTSASNSGGTIIASATSSSYTPSTTVAGTLYYYCVVTNGSSCTATSAVSGAIIVNAVPVVAGVAQAGQFGNGLKFAGSYVLSAVSGTSLTNFTLESYIKFNTNQISGILQWANTLGSSGPFVYWKQDGLNLVMYVYADYRITTTLSLDTWYHVALVYNGTVYTLYINGSPVGTYTGPLNAYNFQNSATGLYLGNGYHGYYSGSMDEVRVWNTARTQSEIQSSLNTELAGTETGLMAYYNFNHGTASGTNTGITTLTDRTSNANNGTLNGFALTGSTSNWVAGAQSTGGSSTAGAVCLNSTIQLSNTTTGGTWSTSDATIATVDNTGLVTGIAVGSATISYTVTNASNCSTTATSSVTVNALPVISSQSTAAQRVIQNGTASAFSVTATGSSLTYQWYSNTTASNTGGTSIASATSSTYTPPTATLGTTYYYCIVTNASGCIATSAVSGAVVIEQMYITSTGTMGTVCYSSTAQTSTLAYTATANNPTSYSIDWNAAANTAGLADQTSTNYTFASGSGTIPDIAIAAGAAAGTYSGTLTIRNTNNITATLAVTITINPLPTITTAGIATAKCFSTSAQTTSLVYTATTQSPISYSIDWSAAANTAGLTDQGTTSFSFVAGGGTLSTIAIPASIPGGTYTGTMTITNANGCANTQAISYTSYALPIAGIRNNTSTTVLTSTVTSISLTATGGSTYSWSNGTSVVSTTAAYRATAPGTYTVTVTNTNGCSATASITITQTSTPPASSITNNTGTTELNCTTTSISLTATGGGTYSWSNGTTVVGTSANYAVTAPGTYTVTVTNGGTTTSSITITENVITSATAVLTGSTTITNGKSANLQATISIGNAPYTVVISDGTSQFTTYSYYSGPNIVVTPSATKTYTLVSVTGANGCAVTSLSGSATVTINSGGTSKVWTGAAGDNLWSTGGNWSPAGTPVSNDFLTISSGTPQLDVYFTVNGSLTVNGTGTLTVNAGKSIDIGAEGVVDFGKRDITFKSSATGTAQLGKIEGTLSNADSVIVERYFPAGRRAYRFISASVTTPSSIRYNWMENATPVFTYTTIYTTLSAYNPKLGYGTHITGTNGNTNGFDRTALNTSTLYTLNTTTQAWDAVGSTSGTLTAGDAYRILIRGDRAINLNNNNTFANATTIRTKGAPKVGLHTVSSSLSTIADGWSLVGNPYQSLVDLRAVSTTNLTPYYSVWDPQRGTRGAYVSYHLGTGIKSNVASDVNELVQPGQAFFVQTLNAGAATLTFEESNKAPLGTHTRVFRPIANYPVLNVALNYTDSLANGAPEMDAFAVVFDNSFSNGVDKEDGMKNYNQDDNMGISRDGKLLAMELRDMYNATTVIPMNMVNYVRQNYTLRMNWSNPIDAGYEAYLKDNYTGATQTISFSSNTDYVFTVNSSVAASKATDRFSILFLPSSALPVSGLELNGTAEGKQVKLQFTALNERDMAGYEIEHSADGINFTKIGDQPAVNGIASARSYAFIHNKPVEGNNYYRVKGTSLNGQEQYSNVKLIRLGAGLPTVMVAPNPAGKDKVVLKVSQLLKGNYTVTVTDALGRIFSQKEMVYDGVSGVMELKFPSIAKSGSYYVKVNGEGVSFTEAFIIQ